MAQDHKDSLGYVAMIRNAIHNYIPTCGCKNCHGDHGVPWRPRFRSPPPTLHSGSLRITGRRGRIRTEPKRKHSKSLKKKIKIGLRENLQENIDFPIKYGAFL